MSTPSKWDGLPCYHLPLGRPDDTDSRPARWITDFSSCLPAERLSGEPAPGCWHLRDYATDRFAGRLLYAPAHAPAGDLTLELEVDGWHAVYLWLMGTDSGIAPNLADADCTYSRSPGPALRLSCDRRFHYRFQTLSQENMKAPGLEGCFWRYADLTGQTLTIRHQGATVWLAALQLVPLSPAEVEAIERDRCDHEIKRLILKLDSYAPEQTERLIETLRDRDVGAVITGINDSADLERPGGSRNLPAFRAACAEIGAACYVCDRPSHWSTHRFRDNPRMRWFEQHPEFHCRERDGTPNMTCSFAEPAVVEYMLRRARLAAAAGIDGFGYCFNRDPHGLVRFEPAALAGFAERHGVDPLTLDERDGRLLAWWADTITGYLRRVRQTLDEEAARAGRARIRMIHVVLGGEAANRQAALDVPRWIEEGLVDVLCPYPFADYPEWWLAQGAIPVDVKYYARLVRGTGVRLVPMWLSNRHRDGWVREHVRVNEFFTKARQDYADGADGLTVWDEYFGLDASFPSDRWLRLGHRDQLDGWIERDCPLPPFQRLTRLDGAAVRRLPVGSGG